MKQFLAEAAALQPQMVEWRRYLHQNPELDLELPLTTAFVKEKLTEMGYQPQDVGPCGIVVTVGGKKPGKCFMLRADMDALPIQEETDVVCKSTNENMHACGHDFHTTMLLGAAKLLKAHEDEIEGTIKLMFQPAEETLRGAKTMLQHGVLDNPKVDAAAMIHVAVGFPFPAGLVVVPDEGAFSAASDTFTINVKGKGGHGAMPEAAIDPLIATSSIHLALQTIRSREVAASDSVVVTVGMINGGRAHNVIPDTAYMEGTIRTFDKELRAFVPKRVKEIAENTAKALRCEAEFTLHEGCPSVVNSKAVTGDIRTILTDTLGPQAVPPLSMLGNFKMNGSEDFSYVAEQVPSAMLVLTAGSPQEGCAFPVHHPKAVFKEDVLAEGAAVYASVGFGWLQKNK